jgi:hypothetical protein
LSEAVIRRRAGPHGRAAKTVRMMSGDDDLVSIRVHGREKRGSGHRLLVSQLGRSRTPDTIHDRAMDRARSNSAWSAHIRQIETRPAAGVD